MKLAIIYLAHKSQEHYDRFQQGFHYRFIDNYIVAAKDNGFIWKLDYQTLICPSNTSDLGTYRFVAERLVNYDTLIFFNSHTRILRDDWLDRCVEVYSPDKVIAMSTSTESFYTNNPSWWRRIFFAPAPNFHMRTNAFMIDRELMLKVWPKFGLKNKKVCYLNEAGRWSITKRLQKAGAKIIDLSELKLISDNHVCQMT